MAQVPLWVSAPLIITLPPHHHPCPCKHLRPPRLGHNQFELCPGVGGRAQMRASSQCMRQFCAPCAQGGHAPVQSPRLKVPVLLLHKDKTQPTNEIIDATRTPPPSWPPAAVSTPPPPHLCPPSGPINANRVDICTSAANLWPGTAPQARPQNSTPTFPHAPRGQVMSWRQTPVQRLELRQRRAAGAHLLPRARASRRGYIVLLAVQRRRFLLLLVPPLLLQRRRAAQQRLQLGCSSADGGHIIEHTLLVCGHCVDQWPVAVAIACVHRR